LLVNVSRGIAGAAAGAEGAAAAERALTEVAAEWAARLRIGP
jgi:hypothetical protein